MRTKIIDYVVLTEASYSSPVLPYRAGHWFAFSGDRAIGEAYDAARRSQGKTYRRTTEIEDGVRRESLVLVAGGGMVVVNDREVSDGVDQPAHSD